VILRRGVFTSLLVLGLLIGPATRSVFAQDSREVRSAMNEFSSADTDGFREVTTRDEHGSSTLERSIIEGPSINGGSTVLSGVEDYELQIGAETTRRTRREFVTDANNRPRLVSMLQERRVIRPDGGEKIVQNYTEPDVNGRGRATRREQEETIAQGDGVFTTRVEVSEPSTNGSRFSRWNASRGKNVGTAIRSLNSLRRPTRIPPAATGGSPGSDVS